MAQEFSSTEKHFLIEGSAGKLELLTQGAKEQAKGLGVICHPHPLHDGTMHNKVVHTLAKAFHHLNLHVVRFNYRGVGKSEGSYGDSVGECEDLLTVIDWSYQALGEIPLWLAGFSFGAYIAAKGASIKNCQQLFSVAPAVTHQPYDKLSGISCPWLMIQGEKDEVVPPEAVYAWYGAHKQQFPNLSLHKVANMSHFFHGGLIVLRNLVEEAFVDVSL